MNFSFKFGNHKQNEQFSEAAKVLTEAAEAYKKAMQESASQYNEHRKKLRSR